jgi:predicted permease
MIFGRLRPGVADDGARSETEALLRDAIDDTPPSRPYAPPEVALVSGARGLARSDDLPFSLVLGSAVGFVLLVACANVAGLLVARATGRRHEIGTRLALGAGRWRLIRQLLTETIVLSLLGGAAGAAMAFILSDSVTESGLEILAFATLLTLGTGIAFGLAPALAATRISLLATLKKASAEIDGARSLGGKTLVAMQVAVSLVLLIGAGLFFQTLFNLTAQPMGFSPENLLVFRVDPSLNGYEREEILDFFETALARIELLPGVESASLSRWGMLTFASSGERVCVPGMEPGFAATHSVAPRFLETMGVPLRAGRDFTWADRENTPSVAVVNDAFSRRYFEGENPIGRTVQIGCGPDAEGYETEIVGVAGDAKYTNLRGPAPATLFIPYRQSSERWMTFAVRTTGNPAPMIPAIREAIASIDPNLALYDMASQAEWIDLNVARERRLARLIAVFAGVSLLLGAIGIYGTLAHLVARRTSEIGLRMALGAPSYRMAWMVVYQSLPPVGIGIGVGLLAAFGATGLVESMLYGVSSSDPATIVLAVLCLLFVAAFAAFLPARRAARVEPLVALRHE